MTFRQFVILIAFFVATIFSFADCKWCGSSSYGSGCPYSPDAKHKHTSNAKKCRWCGSKSHASGCPYSPNKKHEF